MTCDSVCASHTLMIRESPLTRSEPPDCFQSTTTPLPCRTGITSFSPRKALTI